MRRGGKSHFVCIYVMLYAYAWCPLIHREEEERKVVEGAFWEQLHIYTEQSHSLQPWLNPFQWTWRGSISVERLFPLIHFSFKFETFSKWGLFSGFCASKSLFFEKMGLIGCSTFQFLRRWGCWFLTHSYLIGIYPFFLIREEPEEPFFSWGWFDNLICLYHFLFFFLWICFTSPIHWDSEDFYMPDFWSSNSSFAIVFVLPPSIHWTIDYFSIYLVILLEFHLVVVF